MYAFVWLLFNITRFTHVVCNGLFFSTVLAYLCYMYLHKPLSMGSGAASSGGNEHSVDSFWGHVASLLLGRYIGVKFLGHREDVST
jgi:hypothetical protein